jgi:hypothetical protein
MIKYVGVIISGNFLSDSAINSLVINPMLLVSENSMKHAIHEVILGLITNAVQPFGAIISDKELQYSVP